jgi:Uma2 family endonuclease
MPDPAKQRATYQDVLDAPEHLVAEIIDGDLRLSPRPGAPHTVVTSTLGHLLGPPFRFGSNGPGGWIILDEPELHLGEDILVPDLAGWRVERMPVVPDVYFELAPDWVCEALSPSTRVNDRVEKLPIYAAAGVQHVWLIDAAKRSLEVFRLRDGTYSIAAMYQGNESVRAEPFDAVELDLGVLWRYLPVPPRGSRASEGPVPGYVYEFEFERSF